jgi:nucleotide-binding universal stress UspA family protein
MPENHPSPPPDNPPKDERAESQRDEIEQKASQISAQWEQAIEDFQIPCPLCRGRMQAQGVDHDRLYEFAEGEPGSVNPIDIFTVSFVCNRCGYTAEFDEELFNPAYLSRLEGQPPERVAQLVTREYRVLVPLRGDEPSNTLLRLASAIARTRHGDVLVLNAAPEQGLEETLEKKVKDFKPASGSPVPVTLLPQSGENLADSLTDTLEQQDCDLLLIQAKGWQHLDQVGVSSLIQGVLKGSLSDIAVVHDRGLQAVDRVLLTTSGGPNAQAAAPLMLDIVRAFDAELHVLYVATPDDPKGEELGRSRIADTLSDLDLTEIKVQRRVVSDPNPTQKIIQESADYDLLILGGSPQDWRGRLRVDSFSAKIARNTAATAIVVLAQKNRPHSWLYRLLYG